MSYRISETPLDIVISSTSEPKIAEIKQILARLPVTLLTKDDVGGWPEIEETGDSYLANARLKAVKVLEITGRAALADDSGIEVDALQGAPGVRSARFAGEGVSDAQNNAKLVSSLIEVPDELRTARYRCVIVLALPDGRELSSIGTCEGRITTRASGDGGFGYDPWFIPTGETRTMAELTPQEKHSISHRGKALRGLVAQLEKMFADEES